MFKRNCWVLGVFKIGPWSSVFLCSLFCRECRTLMFLFLSLRVMCFSRLIMSGECFPSTGQFSAEKDKQWKFINLCTSCCHVARMWAMVTRRFLTRRYYRGSTGPPGREVGPECPAVRPVYIELRMLA
ncbi:unnamed protein product [Ectocarpus sp. 13 AM-2016]